MTELFEYGVGIAGIVAVVSVTGMFLTHLRKQSENSRKAQTAFVEFLQNHISTSTRASQHLAETIEHLAEMIKRNGGGN